MTSTRYRIFDGPEPYFLTCTVVAWIPVFTRSETASILLDSWRFLQEQKRLTLYGYVILENHVHWIASGPDLSKEVGDFKSFTARKVLDHLESRGVQTLLDQLRWFRKRYRSDRPYQFWADNNTPKQIQSAEMMFQKLEYIDLNPVKRGFIDEPTHWRWSSARNYAGLPALLPVTTNWQ